jgi:dihydroorotase
MPRLQAIRPLRGHVLVGGGDERGRWRRTSACRDPDAAEDSAVAEAIALAAFTAGPLHLCHLSTRGSLALLRIAKEQGLPVTAEVTPHHLLLTDERVLGPAGAGSLARYDTHAKMRPPLRSEADRQALIAALREGLIDAIATDHAPHAPEDKECEFAVAANGVVGLETAFGGLMRLVTRAPHHPP